MDNVQAQGVPAIQASESFAGLPTSQPEVSRPAVVPASPCPNCQPSTQMPQLVSNPVPTHLAYVLCDVDAVYPDLGVEKYALMKMRGPDFNGLAKNEALQLALEKNSDVARQMCYVALVQEVESYILIPRFPDVGYPMLIEAAKSEISAVIGTVGPSAGPDMCNGLTLPILIFDAIFNFNQEAFVAEIPVPEHVDEARLRAAANGLWDQLVPLIGLGTGTNRALAHLLLSDDSWWRFAITEQLNQNAELKSVDVQPVPATTRTLVNVKATFLYRGNLIEKTYYRTFDLTNRFVVALDQPWRQWTGSAL
jgi:hypothetical protein